MFKWLKTLKASLSSDKWQRIAEALTAGSSAISTAGKIVNVETALRLSAAWACIRVTSQAIAALPIDVYETKSDGSKVKKNDTREADILRLSPNASQTGIEFWEALIAWELAIGNSYAEIIRPNRNLIALEVLSPAAITPTRLADRSLVYRTTAQDGQARDLKPEQVMHLKFFDTGNDLGLSPIKYGANTFGAAAAADEATAKLFANGVMSNVVLTSETTLKEGQRELLRQAIEKFAGSSKAWKMMILEAGLKMEKLSMNPEDAQMLETRKFNIEDICRWYGTPPIIIGHAGQGQTMWGSGVEQLIIAWMVLGLNPLMRKIEAKINKQIFNGTRLTAEFNREGLLQIDTTAKASFLSSMTQNGLMTRNEGRAKLNMPKSNQIGADDLTVQTALTTLENLLSLSGGGNSNTRGN